MSAIFKYIFSCTMTIVLLLSTLQVSVSKMTCLKSGRTTYAISEFENCDNKNSCSFNEICCEFQKIIFDYEYDAPIHTSSLTFLFLPFTHETILFLRSLIPFSIDDVFFYTNLPPPSGYDLLKYIETYRL
ncbi:MAG: hypothetical protein J5I47_11935 [Vicingus serpentipes]|nr:hypothetical protein [Vicingus serpentipes]